ncbi:MAG: nucleotide exchange factor GrpE, partial [Bacteroidota bacterium]
ENTETNNTPENAQEEPSKVENQSEDVQAETNSDGEEVKAEDGENEAPQATQEEDPISKLGGELAEAKDKYVRLYAEFENFRRRTNKEKSDIIKNAHESLIRDLLSVVDDFERAFKSFEEAKKKATEAGDDQPADGTALEEGINLVFNKFYKILEQKGLKAMDSSIGKDFDLEKHESITRIPAPSPELKDKIIDEIEKGYYLHDKVIRFAKVVLGS